MTITILVVGKLRGDLAAATRAFEDRSSHYWKLVVIEVASGVRGGDGGDRARRAEGDRLRDRIPGEGELWILTREGKEMSSREFADELERRAVTGSPGVTLVIGGAYGLDPDLTRRADRQISLSRMTLPHALARLVLAEQLYRAGTILRGEPYHKGDG